MVVNFPDSSFGHRQQSCVKGGKIRKRRREKTARKKRKRRTFVSRGRLFNVEAQCPNLIVGGHNNGIAPQCQL